MTKKISLTIHVTTIKKVEFYTPVQIFLSIGRSQFSSDFQTFSLRPAKVRFKAIQ